MKRKLATILVSVALLMTGCISSNAGGAGGFDIGKFVKNPIVMAIIVIAALYFAFKSSGGKHG